MKEKKRIEKHIITVAKLEDTGFATWTFSQR